MCFEEKTAFMLHAKKQFAVGSSLENDDECYLRVTLPRAQTLAGVIMGVRWRLHGMEEFLFGVCGLCSAGLKS